MPTDVPLRCACGTLQGTALAVAPKAGCRVVCYCDDCQASARFLGRPEIVDAWGGTDVFQTAPGKVRFTAGQEALSCLRLSDRGMFRWYCGKCRTPVGNTLSPRVPFVGLMTALMDLGSDGARDQVLGKPLAHSQTKFARGTPPIRTTTAGLLPVIGRSVKLLSRWWLTGAGKPSPFFDDRTRAPRVAPRVLSPEERRALSAAA